MVPMFGAMMNGYADARPAQERIDELLKANTAYLERARKAEGKLRSRSVWKAMAIWAVFAAWLFGYICGWGVSHVADEQAVNSAKYGESLEKRDRETWFKMTLMMTDGMVKQAQRSQSCEDNLTSQFDMRKF